MFGLALGNPFLYLGKKFSNQFLNFVGWNLILDHEVGELPSQDLETLFIRNFLSFEIGNKNPH